MKTSEKLVMSFATQTGGRTGVSVEEPRRDISSDVVRRAMERLIKNEVFIGYNGAKSIDIRKASVIKTTVTEIFSRGQTEK